MGDESSDKLVLRGPEQEDDVSRQGIPVLGQEARCVVDHLVAEEEDKDEDVWLKKGATHMKVKQWASSTFPA